MKSFVMLTRHSVPLMGTLILAIGAIAETQAATPGAPDARPVREVGKYILSDDATSQTIGRPVEIHRQLAGGGLLYSDCTFTGSVIGSVGTTITLPTTQIKSRTTFKLAPAYWVNNPNPDIAPYDLWAVPDSLQNMPRLLLCYQAEAIDGQLPSQWPNGLFCDWAPRDLRTPFVVSSGDGTEDLLLDVEYRGRGHLCPEAPAATQ